MATKDELAERLVRRFKGVPNFTDSDAKELVNEALLVHGLDPSANIPETQTTLILLYAQAQGARQIAFSVAHYFRFSDGEESVDKSMVADNYRRLARDLQTDYDTEKGRLTGSNFRIMKRVDRPYTTPPTGNSNHRRRLRKWRR